MKNLFIVIIASLLLFSCRKKDKVEPMPQHNYLKTEVLQIFSGVVTYTVTSNYQYDAQNRISSIDEVSTDTTRYANCKTSNFVYNADGTRKSCEVRYTYPPINYADRYEYIYDASGRLVEVQNKNIETNAIRARYTYEYAGNTITKRYLSPVGVATQTDVYTLNGNNIVQIKYYNGAGANTSTHEFSNFDTKPNAYKMRNADAQEPTQSINNYRTSTSTIISTGVETNAKYAFEYNADGYPTKRTHLESGRTAEWIWEKR